MHQHGNPVAVAAALLPCPLRFSFTYCVHAVITPACIIYFYALVYGHLARADQPGPLANEPDKRQTETPSSCRTPGWAIQKGKRHTQFWPLLIMTKTVCSRTPTKAQAALSIVHSHALSHSLSVSLAL